SRRCGGISTTEPGGSPCAPGCTAASASACSSPPIDVTMATQPILVAGKSGQLARCLAEEARRRGLALVALGRPALHITDAASVASAVAPHAPQACIDRRGELRAHARAAAGHEDRLSRGGRLPHGFHLARGAARARRGARQEAATANTCGGS